MFVRRRLSGDLGRGRSRGPSSTAATKSSGAGEGGESGRGGGGWRAGKLGEASSHGVRLRVFLSSLGFIS